MVYGDEFVAVIRGQDYNRKEEMYRDKVSMKVERQ